MRNLNSLSKKVAGLLPFLLVAALAACTDEKIVEVERPPFNPPADASSGFLGYYTVGEQQTTCGNCHADFQADWKETGHAEAYATLKANAGAQPFCYSCHTVNEKGNSGSGTIGWDKVQDSTYRDVQCESCHGPGQAHVEGVNSGTIVRPLPMLGVGVRVKNDHDVLTVEKTADTTNSCASCHTGTHHPYVEQWAQSRHAWVRVGYSNNSCATRCHEGRGALVSWGVQPTWKEGAWNATFDADDTPATCAVCHDPHGSANQGQLRFPINVADETQNLCIKCHNNRAQPGNTSNAPHGPQGGVLLGFAGWRPPNFTYDTARIYGSHASTANPSLCAGCHVNRQTFTAANGSFQLQSVGHLFKPVPCLDAQGNPTGDDSCAFTATARSWNACTKSGCHATATVAASAFNSVRTEIKTLQDFLWKNTNNPACSGGSCPLLDPYPLDDGYLPRIKQALPGEWNTPNSVSAPEGCEFNVRTMGEGLAGHPDGSKGTHNAFLARALLSSCISYLKATYPAILPSIPANVQAIIDAWDAPVMGNKALVARRPLPSADY